MCFGCERSLSFLSECCAGEFNDLERRLGPHAGKLVDQKPQQGAAFGVVQHLDQPAELDAVGMGLYLDRSGWELPGAAGEMQLLAVRVLVGDGEVRIGYGGLLQIDLDRVRPLLIVALHLHLDARAVRTVPLQPLLPVDVRLVPGGIDRDIHFRGKLLALDAADDVQRLADGELSVHARGRDPHTLLSARLAELVEFRTVKQLAENAGDLAFDDSRAVILHDHPRFAVAVAHLYADVGEYSRFLTGIESVVDRLFDGGDQCLGGGIEAEQMTILEKEL